jgi:hypothetical protein
MKANKAQQRALITLLNRIYREIRSVEEEWDIRVDDSDYRPRIEYFHDAVRALTANGGEGEDGKGRLSVEFLAYDIGMLRYIQTDPLTKPKNRTLSAYTNVVERLPREQGDKSGLKPDASVRYRLIDSYKSYAVLFSALLSDAAERNYMSRISDMNAEVEDMAIFMQHVAAKGDAQIDVEALADAKINTGDLLNKIIAALKSGKLARYMRAKDARRVLKETAQAIDKEHKAIEQAHFTYATGQLAIYEGARDVIKKMAIKGLNIVGDFVETAVQDAKRGDRGL